MTVYILTYAPTTNQIYGNLLALRTGRTGFPTANIIVTDNASCSEAREIFQQLCVQHGYQYQQLDPQVTLHDYLQTTIDQATGPIVIAHPDCIFWANIEYFNDSAHCVKGRLQPSMFIKLAAGKTLCTARLHTSLLFIRDAQEYNQLLEPLKTKYGNPWANRYTKKPIKKFYDTGCVVYEKLKQHHTPFTEDELDHFDHLLFGTHFSGAVHAGGCIVGLPHHFAKIDDYEKLRGLWEGQEAVWQFAHKQVPTLYR
jgi:hypothetical protein